MREETSEFLFFKFEIFEKRKVNIYSVLESLLVSLAIRVTCCLFCISKNEHYHSLIISKTE